MRLQVEHLSASYGNKIAVDDVSFALAPGQVLALFGHNGAGKTSTLKALMGVTPVDRGSILFDGVRLDAMSVQQRVEIGLRMLPEGRGIFRDLTVLENLKVVAIQNCRPGCLFTPDHIYEFFPVLAERRDAVARTLSGGQQQMLALGLALLGNPKCLMLDEPSLGLAPNLVERIFERVHAVCKQNNVSVILVEQNVAAALRIADRIVIMNGGSLAFEGLPGEAKASDFWDHF